MSMNDLNIRPLGFAAGAEVTGLDLRRTLAEADRRAINDAWLRHLVRCGTWFSCSPART
jgi:taurine dioxygenase